MDLPTAFPGPTGYTITALQLFVTATSFSTETNPQTRAQYSKFSQANKTSPSSTKQATWPSRFAMMVIYTPALLTSLYFMGSEESSLAAVLCAIHFAKRCLEVMLLHQYSKFSQANKTSPSSTKQATWPSRFAMMVIYTPALLTSLYFMGSDESSLAAVLCAIHFAKRCLEVMLLHQYSGSTDRGTPTMIGVYYALVVILIAKANMYENEDRTDLTYLIGSTFFGIGLLGNFYHHYLLARLRSSNQTLKYVAPKGGLFDYVACPHYLFELVGWLGIAIVSHHVNVYLVLTSMMSYLGGRSVAQNEFNKKTFGEKDWPRSRKNLVPYLF